MILQPHGVHFSTTSRKGSLQHKLFMKMLHRARSFQYFHLSNRTSIVMVFMFISLQSDRLTLKLMSKYALV